MQGQIGGVNGYVVIIFAHYILSDKAVWNEQGGPVCPVQTDWGGVSKR